MKYLIYILFILNSGLYSQSARGFFFGSAAQTEYEVEEGLVYVPDQSDDTDIQPAIQDAYDDAVDGNTIVLPEGIFIFGSKITTTKKVSLRGANDLGTTLYRSEALSDATLLGYSEMFLYNTNSRVSSNIVIENIYFKSQIPEVVDNDGGSLAKDRAIKLVKCVDFTIRNCRFDYFGDGAVYVKHWDDLANGLIHDNHFYWNAKGWDASGLGYGIVVQGADSTWITDAEIGTDNFVFIEDNWFEYHRHSIAGGGCGKYVARYNTINENVISDNSSTRALDGHSARGGAIGNGNYFATRAIEMYYNTIVNTKYYSTTAGGGATIGAQPIPDNRILIECAINGRGAEVLSHHNGISGYRFGIGYHLDYTPWGTTYPIPYTPGYISGLALGSGHSGEAAGAGDSDAFHWSNTFVPFVDQSSRSSEDYHDYGQGYILLNRDYHLAAKTGYTSYTYPHPRR